MDVVLSAELKSVLNEHLYRIEELFVGEYKFTLVVRDEDDIERSLLITSDTDLEALIHTMRELSKRESL